MVNASRRALVLLGLVVVLAGCDYFQSPLPGFLARQEASTTIDLSGVVTAGDSNVRYDLAVVGSGTERRLLLLAAPAVEDPETFEYRGRMVVLRPDLSETRRIRPESTIDYFSRPYGYGHDGDLLVGYSVYDETGELPRLELSPPHGLEGSIVVDPVVPSTHLFATPSGRFSSYHLEIRNWFLADWSIRPDAESVSIVPDGRSLSADPALVQLGYQLLGVVLRDGELLFLLSRPSEQIVIGATADLEAIRTGQTVVLLPDVQAEAFRISADRPQASVDQEGFFLLRRNGWFERYRWDGGLVARVTGDISFAREYAFDAEGYRMYRFDTQTAVLTSIGGWW
ncbi:MAG: hypothetical protein ACOC1U_07300 [Spirochaetota bacterium]